MNFDSFIIYQTVTELSFRPPIVCVNFFWFNIDLLLITDDLILNWYKLDEILVFLLFSEYYCYLMMPRICHTRASGAAYQAPSPPSQNSVKFLSKTFQRFSMKLQILLILVQF